MTPLQAKAAIVLSEAGRKVRQPAPVAAPVFDTLDIADVLGVSEAEVTSLLAAAREVVREMFSDLVTAANAP